MSAICMASSHQAHVDQHIRSHTTTKNSKEAKIATDTNPRTVCLLFLSLSHSIRVRKKNRDCRHFGAIVLDLYCMRCLTKTPFFSSALLHTLHFYAYTEFHPLFQLRQLHSRHVAADCIQIDEQWPGTRCQSVPSRQLAHSPTSTYT